METDIARIVISQERIKNKVYELSRRLIHDYKGKEMTMIGVLNGSLLFLADLVRLIPFPVRLDTISAATYGEATFPGDETMIVRQFKIDIKDRDVLIVDDIIDTGSTMKKIMEDIRIYQPRTLKSCVLLNRPGRRRYHFHPDYYGFDIGEDFVVGYGLDYNNKYRNLPYIGELKAESYR